MNKKEIVYHFVKEIHSSFFRDNFEAEFKDKELGPGRALAFFVELTDKNYSEAYYNDEEDAEDIYMNATFEPNKVYFYSKEKIDKLFRIYKLVKVNQRFPLFGKIIGKVVNPILFKFFVIKFYIKERI